jgi:hypothetical protein
MAKGRTVQSTIPTVVADYFEEEAKSLNISLSAVLASVLISEYKKSKKYQLVKCKYEQDDGTCSVYEISCNVDKSNPDSCESFTRG